MTKYKYVRVHFKNSEVKGIKMNFGQATVQVQLAFTDFTDYLKDTWSGERLLLRRAFASML